MKNTNPISFLTLSSLAIALAIAVPAIAKAETVVETETSAGIQADLNSGSGSAAQKMRATLKAKVEADAELRNKTLRQKLETSYERKGEGDDVRKDIRLVSTTTKAERKEIKDDRKEEVRDIRDQRKEDMRNASTSAERWGIRREALLEAFRARQTAFVKQLQLSLRNLEQISGRISDRIVKLEQEGKDMGNAKSLMVTAGAKLDAARVAVDAVVSYNPSTASTTASTTVDLTKPRSIGTDANRALKEARDALKQVVQAIVRAMGLNVDLNATTTATTTTP